jgi:uncharacterized protein (DUF1919 family)
MRPTYPIGCINNEIEIHFMHYKTKEQAYEKSCRRTSRIVNHKSRPFFKFNDADMCTEQHAIEFYQLECENKISFTKNKYQDFDSNFQLLTEHSEFDGLKLFSVNKSYFDLIHYLNSNLNRK